MHDSSPLTLQPCSVNATTTHPVHNQNPGSHSNPPFSLSPTSCNELISIDPCPEQPLILSSMLHIPLHLIRLPPSLTQIATSLPTAFLKVTCLPYPISLPVNSPLCSWRGLFKIQMCPCEQHLLPSLRTSHGFPLPLG